MPPGDRSSGVDAAPVILGGLAITTIVVAARPERLLTIARPEPTLPPRQPMQPEAAAAAVSPAPPCRAGGPGAGTRGGLWRRRSPES